MTTLQLPCSRLCTLNAEYYASGSCLIWFISFDEALLVYAHHPDYFEKYGRKEPTTQSHNPYSYSNRQFDKTVWEIMYQSPERMKNVMQSMNTLEKHLPITGMYDFSWVAKVAKEQPERILFVDVGGGKGQAIRAISKENPELPRERFILQDRPEVIEETKRIDAEDLRGAVLMPHNFHTEQPVKGRCFLVVIQQDLTVFQVPCFIGSGVVSMTMVMMIVPTCSNNLQMPWHQIASA
jgi:hypothetical protein